MNADEPTVCPRHQRGGIRAALLGTLALVPWLSVLLYQVEGAGRVVAWGYNDQGQANVPDGLLDVIAIDAGNLYNLALRGDGLVVAWGDNSRGQVDVPAGLKDVIAISAGHGHSVAVTRDGRVVAWGDKCCGQTDVPANLAQVVTVAGGQAHTLALKSDGTVVGWGDNTYWGGAVYCGQATVPAGLSNVVAIAAGSAHSLALRDDGQVITWGWDFYGQTGLPAELSDVTAISAGAYFSLALKRDGRMVAWGDNNFAQTEVPAGLSLSNVVAIAGGGWHSLALIASGPPVLLRQPRAGAVPSGEPLVLSVDAIGEEPLDYQWQFNGENLRDGGRISGSNTSKLQISAVMPEDAGSYSVVVSNVHGSVTSNPATLTVLLRPPEITTEPGNQTVVSGAPAIFPVSASGSLPMTYQWRRNGVDLTDGGGITGAQTPTLNIAPAGIEDLGVYTVLIRNAYGSVTSAPASLTVILQPPDITEDPVDQSVFSGASVSFMVSATGSLPLSYQWRRNGVDLADGGQISGAETATLNIAAAEPEDLGLYSVEVRNAHGRTMSFPAQLTVVLAPPTITAQPQGQTVALGSTITLQAQATGSLPLSYQWQRDGVDVVDGSRISGVKTSTLTIAAIELGDLGNYRVAVENPLGRSQSKAVPVNTYIVVLRIRQDDAQVVVAWNDAGKGMKLQMARSLANPDWQEVTGSESVTSVNLPITEPRAAFFRLMRPVDLTRFAWIPPGTFLMSGPDNGIEGDGAQGPQTQVTFTRGCWMGKYEVNQREYLAVMGNNPSHFQPPVCAEDLERPVEMMTWGESVAYCQRLTEQARAAGQLPAGYEYRLPTEAEWEYACRAGTTTQFSFGDALECDHECGSRAVADAHMWWCGNDTGEGPRRVGQKLPNGWGLHDMHGNVWEWCQDWWGDRLPGGSVTDPKGPNSGPARVIRGGHWFNSVSNCSVTLRNGRDPNGRYFGFGFRVVLAQGRP